MNKFKSLIKFLLLIAPSKAYSVSPNDIDLFNSMTGNSPTYRVTVRKAQEAFFIQTGFTQECEKFTSQLTNLVNARVTRFIDESTPFDSKTTFAVLGTAYSIGIRQQIAQSFKVPYTNNVTTTISVGATSQSLVLKIPF